MDSTGDMATGLPLSIIDGLCPVDRVKPLGLKVMPVERALEGGDVSREDAELSRLIPDPVVFRLGALIEGVLLSVTGVRR